MALQERLLVFLLRFQAFVLLLAFGAVFLPTRWMAATHEWLGLGTFPEAPITEYLTRSVSLMYGIHGGLFLVLSGNVRRYRSPLKYLILMGFAFGVAMTVIDLRAPMPLYWSLGEGPMLLVVSAGLLYLLRFVPIED
jgi:hypothetical protein